MKNNTKILLTLLLFILVYFFNNTQVQAKSNRKYKITKVEIEGNETYKKFYLNRYILSRSSNIFQKNYYYPSVLEEDINQLKLFYKNNGFLDVSIPGYEVEVDSIKNEAQIKIKISEGIRTHVDGVSIIGNNKISDEELNNKVAIKPGDALKSKKIQKTTNGMLIAYADQGFLDAVVDVDIKIDSLNHLALVGFKIEEKNQYTINNIAIKGLDITEEKIIKREITFKTGEIVSYSKLQQSRRNLNLTGLFKSVFIKPIETTTGEGNKKDILIEVEEALPKEVSLAFGYGTLDKARCKAEILNMNLAGTAKKIGFTGMASFIYRSVEAKFTEPYTFSTRWRTDINLITSYQIYPGYNHFKNGGLISAGHLLVKNLKMQITYRHENSKLLDIKVEDIPEEVDVKVRSIKPSFVYDSRDNLFNPSNGKYAELSNEIAAVSMQDHSAFLRTTLVLKYFKSFGRFKYGSGLNVGWMGLTSGGMENIPLNERFFAGGPYTVRGYGYQKLGPLDANQNPKGGQFQFIFNICEFRYSIYRWFGVATFLDSGGIWTGAANADFADLRYSPGLGLRLESPVGVGRFDIGFNPDPEPYEDKYKIYFSIGQAF